MKRLVRVLAVLALALAPAILVAGPTAAGTDDFTITSFEADYYLDTDAQGRSVLRTVETIVALFPDYNQNHGIIRQLVDDYQGQPTNISIESITDGDGVPLNYETESDDVFLSARIGDKDRYVRGEHTYVITYTQHNVTLFDRANDVEEFYWDANGTGWPQAFGAVTARVHLPQELASRLTGENRCYIGAFGSTAECPAPVLQASDEGVVLEATARDLGPYSNLTIAIGFDPGTFVPRDNTAWASPYFYVELAAVAVAALVAIWALARRRTAFADAPGRPTIVPEYLPPPNASPLLAAIVVKRKRKAVAAQLMSMAVNHAIRIIESPAQGFFAFGNQYTLELLDTAKLDDDELALASVFFGTGLAPGTRYTIDRSDTTVGKAMYTLLQRLHQATESRGWHRKVPASSRFFPVVLGFGAGALAFVMMMLMLDDARGGFLPVLLLIPVAVADLIVLAVVSRRPYTEKGAELRDYLAGLELYISVAEADRLRILQSPSGAERSPVDTADRGQMLKLYERVLPYAVLFGQEKQWAKLLGEYYDQQPPDWYSGSGAFNSLAFASGISSISTTSASAYSGTSSSSGGSGGGGSSGGGGGGGGGGGW